MDETLKNYIKSASDLVTTKQEIRAGFIAMALEKNRKAVPYINQARALRTAASLADSPAELLSLSVIRPALLTASGLSDKSLSHLTEDDKTLSIKGLIEEFLEPSGSQFIDELVYRFLLIKGDGLGGSMRNLAGYLAEQIFKSAVIASLNLMDIRFKWLSKKSKIWIEGDQDVSPEDVCGLHWNKTGPRTLVFNRNVPFVKKNIDLCLLSCEAEDVLSAVSSCDKYIALGELKGGIDPAGADEHWKTARSALERIASSFIQHNHKTSNFFVGAAIEKSMADEIWAWLQQGKLDSACNMTKKDQLASLCNWLVYL